MHTEARRDDLSFNLNKTNCFQLVNLIVLHYYYLRVPTDYVVIISRFKQQESSFGVIIKTKSSLFTKLSRNGTITRRVNASSMVFLNC